ncbi:hypothetical protein [Phenylobacterium sp.]|uniref:hypothetical protein n=1 Tax=Phenylobacterium sp. TaxID=1871053 RepID=UPI0035B4A07F
MDDPYISSATLLVGGLPIGVGIALIVLGLTRPKHAGVAGLERQNIGRRLDAALRMAMGAIVLLLSSLGAVGLAVALIAPTAEAAGATRSAGEAVVVMIMMLAVFSIPVIICGLAFLGGLALFRAGQDLAR